MKESEKRNLWQDSFAPVLFVVETDLLPVMVSTARTICTRQDGYMLSAFELQGVPNITRSLVPHFRNRDYAGDIDVRQSK